MNLEAEIIIIMAHCYNDNIIQILTKIFHENNYIINYKKNKTFTSIDDSFRISCFEIDYRFDNQQCQRNLVHAFYSIKIMTTRINFKDETADLFKN